MSHVEVLLREHVQDLGKCGDVVRVRAGFARNYLMPQRIAVNATEENKKAMARRRTRLDAEEATRSAEIAERVAFFTGMRLEKTMKADEHGHLYGSVKAATVVALLAEAGHEFPEKAVRIDTPIRTIGEHAIRLHVHGDHYAEVTVAVQPEETPEAAS
jgi:large subunit ribosomal protein L9